MTSSTRLKPLIGAFLMAYDNVKSNEDNSIGGEMRRPLSGLAIGM